MVISWEKEVFNFIKEYALNGAGYDVIKTALLTRDCCIDKEVDDVKLDEICKKFTKRDFITAVNSFNCLCYCKDLVHLRNDFRNAPYKHKGYVDNLIQSTKSKVMTDQQMRVERDNNDVRNLASEIGE